MLTLMTAACHAVYVQWRLQVHRNWQLLDRERMECDKDVDVTLSQKMLKWTIVSVTGSESNNRLSEIHNSTMFIH